MKYFLLFLLLAPGVVWAWAPKIPATHNCEEEYQRANHRSDNAAYHACRAANELEKISEALEKR